MYELKKFLELITNFILKIHKTIGFRVFIKYVLAILGILLLLNFRKVVTEIIYAYEDVITTIHNTRMGKRDELMLELSPILSELRTMTSADRVLYIEFHNSKENLVGIPFKYLDLVLTTKKYGIPEFDIKRYHELSSGILSPIFPTLRKNGYVINHGPDDLFFLRDFHEVSDFVTAQDGSVQQVYLNLPGVNTPIGIIILEWLSDDQERNWDSIIQISGEYVARINGLVLSKSAL